MSIPKKLIIPAWFYIVDSVYCGSELFLGVNYGRSYSITDIYKDVSGKKQVLSYRYVEGVVRILIEMGFMVNKWPDEKSFSISLSRKGLILGEYVHKVLEEVQR